MPVPLVVYIGKVEAWLYIRCQALEVEVPAWVEMVHRRRKKAQLAYILRVRFRTKPDVRWIALRTGAELSPIMQMRRDRHVDGAGLVRKKKIRKQSGPFRSLVARRAFGGKLALLGGVGV
jgi:hypothetical protein